MIEYFNIQGVSNYQSPMQSDGQLIHSLNCINFPYGALSKRPGYNSFLGTPDNAQINSLFSWPNSYQSGTTLWLYRASGSSLWYSAQGTGAWTLAGNGTITNGNHVQGAVLLSALILGDGAGSTRHTTNGTSFTNTTGAPVGQYFAQYANAIYTTDGTSSVMTKSTSNDATNWAIGGTSDASSFNIPDEGGGGPLFVAADRLIINKTKGKQYYWDNVGIVDMATKYGPIAPWAIGNIDDTWFYPNQIGVFSFDGANRQLISNPVQRQFYNRLGNGVGTAQWGQSGSGIGGAHIWDYFFYEGTITDDFTGRQINNSILKYDYQKNQFLNWQFNDVPTAMHSYIDANNQRQLIFGNASGQCFQLSLTATSDNGNPIVSEAIFLFTYASLSSTFSPTSAQTITGSSYQKKWNWLRAFFNPGCELNLQYAFSDSLTYQHLKWSSKILIKEGASGDYFDVSDGILSIRFPMDINNQPRSTFLFLRLFEESNNSQWTYYGCQIDAEPQIIR